MVLGAIIGAAAGIGSAIMGTNQANSNSRKQANAANKAMKRQYKYDVDYWNYDWEESNLDRDHLIEGLEIKRENEEANLLYQEGTMAKDWTYKNKIRNYEDRQAYLQYQKSEKNYTKQLGFNNMAAARAYESEDRRYEEIKIGDAFKRQDQMIQGLAETGEAALLQSGRSKGKAIQSALASIGRNTAIMDESLRSAGKQHIVNLNKIATDKYGADLSAHMDRLLRPERSPTIPRPDKLPRTRQQLPRELNKPPKPVKGAKAVAAKSSMGAAILGAVSSHAGSVGSAIKNNGP